MSTDGNSQGPQPGGPTRGWACWPLSLFVFGAQHRLATYRRQPAGRRQRRGGEPAGALAAACQPGPRSGRRQARGVRRVQDDQVDDRNRRSRLQRTTTATSRRVRPDRQGAPPPGRRWARSADQVVGAGTGRARIRRQRRQASPPRVPQLQAQLDEVVRAMSAAGAPSSQVYIALRQVVLAATMAQRVTQIRAGGATAGAGRRRARARHRRVRKVLNGLRDGGSANVQKLANPAAMASLNQASVLWTDMKKDLDAILGSSQNLFARAVRRRADHQRFGHSCWPTARGCSTRSPRSVRSRAPTSIGHLLVSFISGALALLSIVGLLFSLVAARSSARYQTPPWNSTTATRRRSCACWTKWVRSPKAT